MTEGYLYSLTTPQLRRCSVCGALRRNQYHATLEGTLFLFCSVDHYKQGMENYAKNKNLATLKDTPLREESAMVADTMRTSTDDRI